jgi:hypothetical protein
LILVDSKPVGLFFALCVPEETRKERLDMQAMLAINFGNQNYLASLRKSACIVDTFTHLVNIDRSLTGSYSFETRNSSGLLD